MLINEREYIPMEFFNGLEFKSYLFAIWINVGHRYPLVVNKTTLSSLRFVVEICL